MHNANTWAIDDAHGNLIDDGMGKQQAINEAHRRADARCEDVFVYDVRDHVTPSTKISPSWSREDG